MTDYLNPSALNPRAADRLARAARAAHALSETLWEAIHEELTSPADGERVAELSRRLADTAAALSLLAGGHSGERGPESHVNRAAGAKPVASGPPAPVEPAESASAMGFTDVTGTMGTTGVTGVTGSVASTGFTGSAEPEPERPIAHEAESRTEPVNRAASFPTEGPRPPATLVDELAPGETERGVSEQGVSERGVSERDAFERGVSEADRAPEIHVRDRRGPASFVPDPAPVFGPEPPVATPEPVAPPARARAFTFKKNVEGIKNGAEDEAMPWVASIARRVERYERDHEPFAVLVIELVDVERLRHAELPGEIARLTSTVETALAGELRPADSLMRESPGRYWLLAPETDPEGARALAGRLAEAVDGAASHRGAPLRIAVGLAACPSDGLAAGALAAHADIGLYAARAAGRPLAP